MNTTKAIIYRSPISTYEIAVVLGAEKATNKIIPVESYIRSTGLLWGTMWKTRNISVDKNQTLIV